MKQRYLEIVLALIKHREMHVRAIAEEINQAHANVSRSLKELLRKNVVDFTIEGKNKVYRLKKTKEAKNYAYIAEHYKTLKVLESYPRLSVIAEEILAKTNAPLIILFGSYAKLKAKKDSDIDIYLETQDKEAKEKIQKISSRLSIKTGKLEPDNPLTKEIRDNHAILRGVERYYENHKVLD